MAKKKFKVKKNIALTLVVILGIIIALFITMLLLNVTDYGITLASFGATIFILFGKNKVDTKKIFGAYIVATIVGFSISYFNSSIVAVALAAVSSVVFMTLLKFQHAPAIGLAVAAVINQFSFITNGIILGSILLIFAMIILLRMFLKDPQKILSFVEIEEEKINWNIKDKPNPQYIELG